MPCNGNCTRRIVVKLGATASPGGEEFRTLFWACEECGPMLAYPPQDLECKAMVAMRERLYALYRDAPTTTDLEAAAEILRALLQGHLPVQLPPLRGGGCHRGAS